MSNGGLIKAAHPTEIDGRESLEVDIEHPALAYMWRGIDATFW